MPRKPMPIAERFWPKVDVRGSDECWPWLAARNGQGYGQFVVPTGTSRGVLTPAPRVAWELAHGRRAGVRMVRHTCDNPLCCNPVHLRLGTALQNVQDAIKRGRAVYVHGEKHGMAKLTAKQVEAIRADGRVSREIAPEYGVSDRHIRKIRARKTWSR
jgi:HNH endonuclease